jgi:hypothetical protein
MKKIGFVLAILLTGCAHSLDDSRTGYQRFVLVPNPSEISKDIPAGALALDTKTGQLCYTVGGSFTSGSPAMDMCSTTYKDHP